jgi:Ca2+-binding EF-hand superfamily protein
MTIDLEKLIEWLGVEGAIAGLDGSDLTTAELGELMPESKRSGHSKLKRRDLIKAMVEQKRLDLTKKPEELMAMDADSLKAYFLSIKASKKEILDLLESMDIRPGSVARNNLTEFAAREISDIGMYRRVAQGTKLQDVSDGGSSS